MLTKPLQYHDLLAVNRQEHIDYILKGCEMLEIATNAEFQAELESAPLTHVYEVSSEVELALATRKECELIVRLIAEVQEVGVEEVKKKYGVTD